MDNVHKPARLYGTTQFLGVGTIDIDPNLRDKKRVNGGFMRKLPMMTVTVVDFVSSKVINLSMSLLMCFSRAQLVSVLRSAICLEFSNPKDLFWTNGTKTEKCVLQVCHCRQCRK